MKAASAATVIHANFGTDVRVGKNDVCVGIFKRMRDVFRDVWPKKSSLELADAVGVSERSAERILGGDNEPSGRTICTLLRGPHGDKILDAIMEGSDAKWHRRQARARKLAEMRRRQEEHRKALEQFELDFAAD